MTTLVRNKDFLTTIAPALVTKGKPDEAEATADSWPRVLLGTGILRFKTGRVTEALQYAKEKHGVDPRNARVYIGICLTAADHEPTHDGMYAPYVRKGQAGWHTVTPVTNPSAIVGRPEAALIIPVLGLLHCTQVLVFPAEDDGGDVISCLTGDREEETNVKCQFELKLSWRGAPRPPFLNKPSRCPVCMLPMLGGGVLQSCAYCEQYAAGFTDHVEETIGGEEFQWAHPLDLLPREAARRRRAAWKAARADVIARGLYAGVQASDVASSN